MCCQGHVRGGRPHGERGGVTGDTSHPGGQADRPGYREQGERGGVTRDTSHPGGQADRPG